MKIGDLVKVKPIPNDLSVVAKDLDYSIGIVIECSNEHNAVKVLFIGKTTQLYLFVKDRLEIINEK